MAECDPRIEQAIMLVVRAFENRVRMGPVPIPACTHSLSVGLMLLKYGCPADAVLGGFCHDLLEDTGVSLNEIKRTFGEEVASFAEICTIDQELEKFNRESAEMELYLKVVRIAADGKKDALLIKIADCFDNLKTNADIPQKLQLGLYECGVRWHEAGLHHFGHCPMVEDFEVLLSREKKRLGQ